MNEIKSNRNQTIQQNNSFLLFIEIYINVQLEK